MPTQSRGLLIGLGALVVSGATVLIVAASVLAWLTFDTWSPAFDVWQSRTDPMGFSVEVPRGWSVRSDPASGRIEIQGRQAERLVLWPVFVRGPLESSTAGLALSRIAPRLWPEARWQRPEAAAKAAVRVRGSAAGRRGVCALAWVRSAEGSAGLLTLVTVSEAGARQSDAVWPRILGSLRFTGAPARRRDVEALRYVRWEDPRERAFSAEVPAGWRMDGGAVRPNLLVVQARVEATSPDGAISLYLGDAFPVYVEPNPMLAMAGIGPGGTYVDQMGNPTPVQSYLPGDAYAVRAIVPQRVGRFDLVRRTPRPDIARRLVSVGMNRYDAGEVEYRFARQGQEYRGWALCVTERVQAGAGSLWHVWRLCLAEAPASRFETASAALVRLAETFHIDRAWAERQARLTAAQSRIIADMGESISRSMAESNRTRQSTIDEISRRGANARREVEQVTDPATGRELTVSSGSNYYWMDNRGNVVGTETSAKPSFDYRELTTLP